MQKAPTAALHSTRLLFDGSTLSGTLSWMDFALPSSSSRFQTSSWIFWTLLQKGGVFDHCQKGWVLDPVFQRFLMMSLV